jgi:3-dehydroquinate synthase
MPPIRIDVTSAQRTYPVIVGAGLLAATSQLLADAGLRHPVVVTVPPVWRRHGQALTEIAGVDGPILMGDGERYKTLPTVAKIYDAFIKRSVARTSTVLAVGGGVVGDVAGFAAASFLRGVPFVQVPTTLLAQVDSAIGGKVGVNLVAGKNLVGAFHAPSLVICDTAVLGTLARREFRAGLYEVVKYGVIASRPLFDAVDRGLKGIFKRDHAALTPLVTECCQIKARVVAEDEYERGPRRVLNFGHTVGHALEAVTGYKRFRHGEAIGYGMRAAAAISVRRGLMPVDDANRLTDLLQRMGPLPAIADLKREEILNAIGRDKKVANGRLHFVLCAGLGSTSIADDVTPEEIDAALDSLIAAPAVAT